MSEERQGSKKGRGSGPVGAVPPAPAPVGRPPCPAVPTASSGAPSPEAVVAWYGTHRRDLPWRRPGTTPWGVLVSEVMSQQTPVARVAPAWEAWMRRWPTPAALAAAPTAEVLHAWGRLGYPRRALRLAECAAVVVERHGGRLPTDLDALLALPGVGEYTAGAVLAFAYGRRALVLDTNVRRVLARAVSGAALPAPGLTRAERERAATLLPHGDAPAARWSVAVMELGALVCTAREPSCGQCPWREECAWLAAGRPPDEHAHRRRTQAWHGTDRQARGLVMARLRQQHADAEEAEKAPAPSGAHEVAGTAGASGASGSPGAVGTTARRGYLGLPPETAGPSGAAGVSGASGDVGDPGVPGPTASRPHAGLPRAELLAAAAGVDRRRGQPADPAQPARVLDSLLADGLIATHDGGATYRLP